MPSRGRVPNLSLCTIPSLDQLANSWPDRLRIQAKRAGAQLICLIRCQGPKRVYFSRCRENCRETTSSKQRSPVPMKVSTSPLAVGRVAISGIRIREFTEQLSIIAGNGEHNCSEAKSAESRADPKHSHEKSPFELGLWQFLALRTEVLV